MDNYVSIGDIIARKINRANAREFGLGKVKGKLRKRPAVVSSRGVNFGF